MCDLDNHAEYTEYEPVSQAEIDIRRDLGQDIRTVGISDDFISCGDQQQKVQWKLLYDYSTGERLRVRIT